MATHLCSTVSQRCKEVDLLLIIEMGIQNDQPAYAVLKPILSVLCPQMAVL